jgi:hypothetical protein
MTFIEGLRTFLTIYNQKTMAKILLLEKGNYGYGLLTEQDAGYISAELNPQFMKEGFSMAKENQGQYSIEVNCILQKADTENRNGRVYPFPILKREANKYQELIDVESALGECNHPNEISVNLDNISHRVTKMWWDNKTLYGKLEFIVTEQYAQRGEYGGMVGDKLAIYLNKYRIKLGISSRGVGSVRSVSGLDVVQEDFELVCFDIVSSPSTPGAYLFRGDKSNNTIQEQVNLNANLLSKDEKKIKNFLSSFQK